MSRPVMLLDWDETPLRVFQAADWKLRDRGDSTNRLTVTTSLAEAKGVRSEQEVIFKGRRFAIEEIDSERADGLAEFKADEVQAELKGHVLESYEANSWTLTQALDVALEGTRWTMGEVQGTRYGRSHFEDITVLDVLKFLASHQDARLSFDSLRRRVNITPQAGKVHEIVFTYGRQLSNIRKVEKAPRTTVIHPTGADGLTVASVNNGETSVEDYGYYLAQGMSLAEARQHRKEEYWEDSRYTVAENLLRDAQKRLAEEAYPQISYTLTAAATTSPDGLDDFNLGTLHLGDQVYVWDNEIPAKLRAEVTEVTTSSDATVNRLTLAYLPESLDAGLESAYFGDSGRPADGPSQSVSVPQPRPSQPILVSINDLGNGKMRWNGQDEHGDFETIPEKFGTLETRAAKLLADGSIPSPDSEDAFSGTVIETRGGGVSSVSFDEAGEYVVWFRIVSPNGVTVSAWSEALVIDAPELVDSEEIHEELQAINGPDGRLPALEYSLSMGLDEVYEEIADRQIDTLAQAKIDSAEQAQEEYDRLQAIADKALAAAGGNVVEDPGFETSYWGEDWAYHTVQGDPGRWDFSNSRTQEGSQQQLLIRPRDDGAGRFRVVRNLPVKPGQVWRVGATYRRRPDMSGGSANAKKVSVRDQAGGFLFDPVNFLDGPLDTWNIGSGDFEVPSGVTSIQVEIWADHTAGYFDVDDLAVRDITQAYEAIQKAESALAAAQAAQSQAGNAEATAQAAMDRANSKSRAYSSTSAPSGTADDGSLWYRWSSTGADRKLLGIWVRESGAWQSMGTLDPTLIPILDAAVIGTGQLDADRIGTQSLTARHVRLGAWDNLIPDPKFNTSWWRGLDQSYKQSSSVVGPSALSVTQAKIDAAPGGRIDLLTQRYEAVPNAQYSLSFKSNRFQAASGGANDVYQVWVKCLDANGVYVTQAMIRDNYGGSGGNWDDETFTFTIPDRADVQLWELEWRIANIDGGALWIANPSMRQRLGASMYVDGSVGAVAIDVEDLAADVARMNKLWVGLASISEAQIDSLLGNSAKFKEIAGAVIRGGRIESDVTLAGEIQAGDRFTGGSGQGGVTLRSGSDSDGIILGWDASGTASMRLGGRRNYLRGDLTADNLDLQGALSVGGGEGGLEPVGNGRVRLTGRQPTMSGSGRDTFFFGTSPLFIYSPGNAQYNEYDVVYPEPTPWSDRLPLVTAHIRNTSPGGVTANSTDRDEFGFTVRSQPLFTFVDVQQGEEWPRIYYHYAAIWQ